MGFAIPHYYRQKKLWMILSQRLCRRPGTAGFDRVCCFRISRPYLQVASGVIIRSISDDSDLKNKGVMEDDIITKINGKMSPAWMIFMMSWPTMCLGIWLR